MKTILVVGATGQQGGGVVDALLASSRTDITIRALTRNPSSSSAQKLQAQGAHLCQGDLLDDRSVEEALRGVDAAYLVTEFRGPKGVEGELEQGYRFVDAAKRAG